MARVGNPAGYSPRLTAHVVYHNLSRLTGTRIAMNTTHPFVASGSSPPLIKARVNTRMVARLRCRACSTVQRTKAHEHEKTDVWTQSLRRSSLQML